MNVKVKSLSLYLTMALCAVATARFCHHQTRGFRISKITSNLIADSSTNLQESPEFVSEVLKQKFRFLGRGLQSFAFISEDDQTVLKIFNNRYQRKIQLYTFLSALPFLGPWAQRQKEYFTGKLAQTFTSYKIAFEEMQEQTGLLYAHLAPTTDLPSELCVVDPLNICHSLDPNTLGFVIQKKATQVYPGLKGFLNRGDMQGARYALTSLISLFFWKWRHGISDNDPLIRTNYGFVGDQAIQIDVGPLSHHVSSLEERRQGIERITRSLKFWLTENAPELLPFLDRELERQLSWEE